MPSNHTDEEIEKQVSKIEKMFQDAFDEMSKPKGNNIMGRLLQIQRRRAGTRQVRPMMGAQGNGSGQGTSSS